MATTPAKTPFLAFKIGVLTCLFFDFLAWLLLLGGISALEAVCNGGCRAAYGLSWWIIWFQLFLLIIAVISEVLDRLAAFRQTFAILLAINVTLCIIQINNYLNVKDALGHSSTRLNATLAGFIMTAIFSILLILLSGSRAALHTRYGEDRDVGVATYPQKARPASPATNDAQFVSQPPPQSTYGTTAPGSVAPQHTEV